MRAFKNKWFNNWAKKEKISDRVLAKAAVEIIDGNVEANLGSCLFKKRLQGKGKGKRGGYRIVVGYRRPNDNRVIFLYAFSKNEKGNMSDKEEIALSTAAEGFILTTDKQLKELMAAGKIWEVQKDE